MNEENYTSLKLSKLLYENGCDLESEYVFFRSSIHPDTPDRWSIKRRKHWSFLFKGNFILPCYDILNDICVKYAVSFFGEKRVLIFRCWDCKERMVIRPDVKSPCHCRYGKAYQAKAAVALHLLQENKRQDAEDYIWEHTIFNPKNK